LIYAYRKQPPLMPVLKIGSSRGTSDFRDYTGRHTALPAENLPPRSNMKDEQRLLIMLTMDMTNIFFPTDSQRD
jgi:hypothetical protein